MVEDPNTINAPGSLKGDTAAAKGGEESGTASTGGTGLGAIVLPGKITIEGPADEQGVQRVLRKHRSELKWCYKQTLEEHPDAAGKVVFGFEVEADGSVGSAEIVSSDMEDTAFAACALSKIERWPFPKNAGKEKSDVQVPVTLIPSIAGVLDKEDIREVVKNHRNEIRYCFEKELQNDRHLAGQVIVTFIVAGNGNVTSAKIKNTTLDSSAVEGCMTRAIKRWVFPEPRGGGIVIVNYPFNFSSSK